ncbi:MAG: hypothetical protein QMD61_02550 [Methanobacterium sp.]|nr:hypothetical protein [Methanobacterium sp.]
MHGKNLKYKALAFTLIAIWSNYYFCSIEDIKESILLAALIMT